jgi:L-ascorbate metabolism protein UlaG (beta-lactamase superfamily)
MEPQHMNPEDAVKVLTIIEAEQALGHHWGTFRLTDEGIEEPPQDLVVALQRAEIPEDRFRALRPGEVWSPSV